MRTDVMGVGFDDLTLCEAAERSAQLIGQGGFHYVVTPNPELVMRAEKDGDYRDILNKADLVVPDGIGVIKAAKILGRPLKERCPGVDLAALLMADMAKKGQRLFLLGAKPGVAELAGARLGEQYPGLVVCGCRDGYFDDAQAPAVAAQIRASAAQVVFVCLGAPKQEQWMARWGEESGVGLAIGLGGALDVFAGVVERAPERWQKLGLEWLYRLWKEPARAGRMARLPLFLVEAALARIRGK